MMKMFPWPLHVNSTVQPCSRRDRSVSQSAAGVLPGTDLNHEKEIKY